MRAFFFNFGERQSLKLCLRNHVGFKLALEVAAIMAACSSTLNAFFNKIDAYSSPNILLPETVKEKLKQKQ